jgi:hypothetical protein
MFLFLYCAYPLRARRSAVYTFAVPIRLCYGLKFAASLRVDLPHLISAHLRGAGVDPCCRRNPHETFIMEIEDGVVVIALAQC